MEREWMTLMYVTIKDGQEELGRGFNHEVRRSLNRLSTP